MIPVRLELHNFLSYREPPPLDFTGMNVACLAGPNGAGKSSLLDAMTWAMWGEARARRDDELIHTGETEMSVTLDFVLDDNLYRVSRYRSRQGKGRSALSLEVMDGEEWRALTESTIRATQEKIDLMLRLDYPTFINSAMLLQGRADEFTTKTPGERKEILSEILGLEVWSDYEERAKAKLKSIDQQQASCKADIERIEEDLASEDDYQQELIQAQNEQIRLADELAVIDGRAHEIEVAQLAYDERCQRQDDLRRRIAQAEREIGQLESEIGSDNDQLAGLQRALEERADIEAGYQALIQAREADRQLGERLRERTGWVERQHALERAIDEARSELEAERRTVSDQIARLERTISECPSDGAPQQTRAEIAALQESEAEREALQTQRTALKEEAAGLTATNKGLHAEMDTLDIQARQLKEAQTPTCPLCKQPLDDAYRDALMADLESEGREKAEGWRINRERLDAIADEDRALAERLEKLTRDLRRLPPLQKHLAELESLLERSHQAAGELEPLRVRQVEIGDWLDQENYAHEARSELAEVNAQLDALTYDGDEHETVQAALAELQAFEERWRELEHAQEEIPHLQEAVARREERILEWCETLAEDQAKLEAVAAELEQLQTQLADAAAIFAERERLRHEEGMARQRIGAAEQKLTTLEAQRERKARLQEQMQTLREEQSIYEELRTAFGKNGVPAMIIEAVIPEIEQVANQLLARMTNGRMHIGLETQREKVTGGVAETLDIRIADELGTRDYQLYSGGEAFRVNFAIRLALSKLLARRAGAQLRTLFIDEGFGTQDTEGRDKLVQAINAIRDDFDLVLVITHIEELKESFPVRIEVSKTPNGSEITLY
jgi:exonuclease SbcC